MAWNSVARPADHMTSTTDKWRNVFIAGEAITFTLSAGAATTYQVRNYYGTIVASGAINGTTLTLPALPLGWYRIYYVRPTSIGSPWMVSGGEDSFAVVRAGGSLVARPPFGTGRVNGGDVLVAGHDIPARAFTGIGALRITTPYGNTGAIDGANLDADYWNTWWTVDPARPAAPFVSFNDSYGLVDSPTNDSHIATVVGNLMPKGVSYYEGFNEPNNAGATVANTITQIGLFSSAVHAANASAKVMAPCTININSQLTSWVEPVLAGAGSNIDVISFHNYNGAQGDLPLMRRVFDGFEAMLVRTGQQNKPRFNTEFGSSFMAVYGSFEPRLQSQWTMLELHMHEQYKIPKENTSYFYDWSHGFWSFPSFWILNNNGEPHPGPLMVLMRVWSEELFGKNFAERLDFGAENDHWLGSRFTNSTTGASVVAVQGGGRTGSVMFTLSGATSVEVVDAWGNVTTATASNGVLTLDVGLLPTYVRLTAGVTLTPVQVTYGHEVTRNQLGRVASASNPESSPSIVIDGSKETEFRNVTTDTMPAWWQIDYPNPTRFDRVVVTFPPPWQNSGAGLDFDVQYWDGTSWVVFGTATETSAASTSFQWTSAQAGGGCYGESFYSRQHVFHFSSPTAVEATKVRVYVRDHSYGGGATADVEQCYGIPGATGGQAGQRRLTLRSVEVFLSGTTDGGTAVKGQPCLALK